ncbi:MAG: hypothetical protein ISS71_09720 [Phycisphaerae bacterium]|nr:hypothetical protein [Phycisphaerae bacterium]
MSIKKKVLEDLCPDGVWQLSEPLETMVNKTIRKLPKKEVTTQERRYPTTHEGMRACLDGFFARHFFQVQDAALNRVVSEDFLPLLKKGRVRILDIGAGPGVTTLGVVDVLRSVIQSAQITRPVVFDCVFNDPCQLCLSYCRHFSNRYFQRFKDQVLPGQMISVAEPFPECGPHLDRIAQLAGKFDIILLSYILDPLFESYDKEQLKKGFEKLQRHTGSRGFVVAVQDRFHERFIRKAAGMLETRVKFHTLKQKIYSEENSNDFQNYYFFSTIKDNQSAVVKPKFLARIG